MADGPRPSSLLDDLLTDDSIRQGVDGVRSLLDLLGMWRVRGPFRQVGPSLQEWMPTGVSGDPSWLLWLNLSIVS